MRKLFILFAALTLSVGLWAIDGVKYIDANGQEQTADNVTEVTGTEASATLNAGWYIVEGANVDTRTLVCSGAVHLILADGAKLTATGDAEQAGIQVSGDGNSLTIYGQANQSGQLIATGGEDGAGIGSGGDVESGTNITINGGTVTANGGNNAAGIGGGIMGDGSNIIINGGTVTATGGNDAAGIGGGEGDGITGGAGSNITINGGKVIATGGEDGAGIGGGIKGSGSNITINGGEVIATGEKEGAGIGGGKYGAGSNITINGGKVIATGEEDAAGIGGGNLGGGSNITINGGDVTATGGKYNQNMFGAGIGNGYQSKTAASDIKVATTHIVKAGDTENPTEEIATDRTDDTDIASGLAGKQYVTIKITESALSAYRAAAIAEIEDAIEGVADGDIRDIADKAIEEINAATTEEDVNSIKNKAMADIEAAAINLPQTKADAIAEIDAAVKDVIDADVLAIADKAKTDINKAITVEKVNTIKTQALAELAIPIKIYNSGKAAAKAELPTDPEGTAGHTVTITKGDKTLILVNPDKVTYGKQE